MSLASIFDIAGSGMSAQMIRLNVAASNITNAETMASSPQETFKARSAVFQTVMDENMDFDNVAGGDAPGQGVKVSEIVESDKDVRKEYRPNHPLADENGFVYLPNVNTMEEMTNIITASRDYQRNIQVMTTARNMIQKTLQMGN